MNEEQTEKQNTEENKDLNILTEGKLAFLNEAADGLQISSVSGMFQNWFWITLLMLF